MNSVMLLINYELFVPKVFEFVRIGVLLGISNVIQWALANIYGLMEITTDISEISLETKFPLSRT